MKTINKKQKIKEKALLCESDKAPCYFASIEKSEKRKDWKWIVGVKYLEHNDEFSFKISKIGDVSDEKTWIRITGVDLAIELIDMFREGGTDTIKTWVKNGCP